jgi:hypothetical protein
MSGPVTPNGVSQFPGNIGQVVGANFTTTSAVLALITGLTFNLSLQVNTWSFDCHLIWSPSASVNVILGIQIATNAPVNWMASIFDVDQNTGAQTSGVALTQATAAATTLVTIAATAAHNYITTIRGTIEGTSILGSTLNMMGGIAGANTLTVFRGSSVRIF